MCQSILRAMIFTGAHSICRVTFSIESSIKIWSSAMRFKLKTKRKSEIQTFDWNAMVDVRSCPWQTAIHISFCLLALIHNVMWSCFSSFFLASRLSCACCDLWFATCATIDPTAISTSFGDDDIYITFTSVLKTTDVSHTETKKTPKQPIWNGWMTQATHPRCAIKHRNTNQSNMHDIFGTSIQCDSPIFFFVFIFCARFV